MQTLIHSELIYTRNYYLKIKLLLKKRQPMKNVQVEEVDDYVMNVKEITFSYEGLRFAIRKNVSPSYSESFIIDLNIGDDKLSEAALADLKSEILDNYEIDDLKVGDDFDLD